ncbi:MAG: hypothetical protein AB9869_11420 [Verrucomicrobiia bacterium]
MHEFSYPIAKAVEDAIKHLLSEKHLYQAVEPDLSFIPELAKKVHRQGQNSRMSQVFPASGKPPAAPTPESIAKSARSMVEYAWTPHIRFGQDKGQFFPITGSASNPIQFQLPTINTFCSECQERWPFNPVFDGAMCVVDSGQSQRYFLGHQCQQCKGIAIRFMLRREGMKLRLVGRDPIEVLPTPKVVPKAQSKFFADAQIAYHAGQTLAALFLLRTFVEQYWRSLPEVQALIQQQPRATGDEQGSTYQATLPVDFRNRFPSLSDIYGKLSAAMHEAKAEGALFEECCGHIVEHFEARKLFRL